MRHNLTYKGIIVLDEGFTSFFCEDNDNAKNIKKHGDYGLNQYSTKTSFFP